MKKKQPRTRHALGLALITAALPLTAVSLHGALIAQDDFDTYVPGAINGLNGGNNGTSSALGWTGAWSGISGATVSLETIKYPIAGTSPVEYLALGQSLKVAATGNNVVTRTLPASGGADRYVSFYFEIKNGGTDNSPVGGNIFAGWQALDAAGSSTNYTAGLLGVSGKAGARVGDSSVTGGNSQYLDEALLYNKGYFAVVRYFGWSGGRYRQCQIWLNPANQSSTSKTATTTTSGVGSAGFDGLRLRTLNLGVGAYYLFDNLRVGTTWSDVTAWGDVIGMPPPVGYTVNTDLGWAPYQLAAPVSGSDGRALGISQGSVFDHSALNGTTAAGANGFIKTPTNNQFVFLNAQNIPVRFAGVNICEEATMLTTTQAAQLADDLKRSGYNAVRLHNFDKYIVVPDPADSKTFKIDDAAFKKVDNLFRALKSRGIYISIDLYSLRGFSQEEVNDMVGLNNIPSGFGIDEFKALIPINTKARASWRKYAQALLTHVNTDRTSGPTRWIDDPALISICMVNEDNLYAQWNAGNGADLHPYVKQLYTADFNANQALYATLNDTPDERFSRFLFAKHLASDNDNRGYLQSLGVKALLTGTNYGGPDQPLVYQRSTYDYVDEHIYYNHPYYTGSTGWTPYTSHQLGSLVVNNALLPRTVMASRVFDKPFTVSEWNISRPNRYRGEAAVLMPALASLQDWNGLFTFQYAHKVEAALDSKFYNAFNLTSDPINLVSSRITALLFRRGDIAPAPVTNRIAWAIRKDDEAYETPGPDYVKGVSPYFGNVGFVTQIGMLPGSLSDVLAKPNIHAAVTGTTPAPSSIPTGGYTCDSSIAAKLTNTGGVNKLSPGSLSTALTTPMTVNSGSVTSHSSRPQIKIESKEGIASVVAPRCELFALGAGKTTTGVQVASIENKATPASVCFIAVDSQGNSLANTARILVAHLTDSLPQGAQFSDSNRKSYTNWGGTTHLVARGETVVTIWLTTPTAPATWKAHVLDHTGRRVGRTISMTAGATSNGKTSYSFTLSTVTNEGTQLLYELFRG